MLWPGVVVSPPGGTSRGRRNLSSSSKLDLAERGCGAGGTIIFWGLVSRMNSK